jgi:hypothetical protein
MTELVRVRGLNRGNIRIGKVKISPTRSSVLDLDDAATRQGLSHHSAIGAVVVVGDAAAAIQSGAVVTAGTGLSVSTSAGVLVREDGTSVTVGASANLALTTANATNPRIDLVVVDNSSGAVSKVDGVAAATPIAPDPGAGKTVLAQVRVNATAVAPSAITDYAPRLA